MSYKVLPKRHLAKTISYRLVSTGVGFLIMWYATGSIKIGAAFGAAELLLKPIIYYFHERAWYKWTKFGLIEEKKPKLKKVQLTDIETKVLNEVQTISEEPTDLNEQTKKKVLSYSSNR
jgi:uncharacterized membrane protein